MKQFTFSFAAFILSVLFVACKKDKTIQDVPAPTIAGAWAGQYGYYEYPDTYYYGFNIKSNGVIQEVNIHGVIVGEGTWKMNGNAFTATYKSTGSAGKTYSVAATYDAALKKLTGTWGKGNNVDTGEWYMLKK